MSAFEKNLVDRLITPVEVAERFGLSVSWLAKSRLSGNGPSFLKIGRSVRYSESHLRDYLRQRTRSSTSER